MSYLCPHPCEGRTEYGYCRYTWCINPLHSNLGTAYQGQGVQKQIITNADRIRAMSDEELANFLPWVEQFEICKPECDADNWMPADCQKCWLDWLQKEATE